MGSKLSWLGRLAQAVRSVGVPPTGATWTVVSEHWHGQDCPCYGERMNRTQVGRRGEDAVAVYLQAQGYRLLARNWRKRTGEIDLIALEGDTLVFVEVKTRRTLTYGVGEESIDLRKQAQLARLAQRFIHENPQLQFRECRFDVVVVDMTVLPVQIRLYRDAFYPPDEA
ncbi:MAG: YraN family protein [Fimbriimonadales bacterium]|nr:YraN family protein [Fimbriimonadales bacterium]